MAVILLNTQSNNRISNSVESYWDRFDIGDELIVVAEYAGLDGAVWFEQAVWGLMRLGISGRVSSFDETVLLDRIA